jgi:hypothetical protein
MAILKKKLNKILTFVSIGVLLAAVFWVLAKEKNSSEKAQSQSPAIDTQSEKSDSAVALKTGNEHQKVCRDYFEQNQNDLVARGYTLADVVDCGVVGCGGIF